jgi:hypothetical protein
MAVADPSTHQMSGHYRQKCDAASLSCFSDRKHLKTVAVEVSVDP